MINGVRRNLGVARSKQPFSVKLAKKVCTPKTNLVEKSKFKWVVENRVGLMSQQLVEENG